MNSTSFSRRSFLQTALFGTAGLAFGGLLLPKSVSAESSPAFNLPPLPYAENALEPYISAKTLSFHYGKHHQAYVTNLNKLLQGSPLLEKPLEDVVIASSKSPEQAAVFNNAAQAWNHTFYWYSLHPKGGGKPSGKLASLIDSSFGSFDNFKQEFAKVALGQFGSGWAWLVKQGDSLKILKTSNADTPITQGIQPLLVLDVWEHAYYLDYQNKRADYLTACIDHLLNWEFAAANLEKAS